MTKQTKQQKIEEIVEVLLKYLPMPVKKRASKVTELAKKIIQLLEKYKYLGDVNERSLEKELRILISESPAEIKFELDAKKLAEAIVEISQIILSDDGNGGGPPPPKDPPQYLFNLLKQETEQLWQRSIMLLTIFAGIFTAYGKIILPIFKTVGEAYELTAEHHFFAALVALIGVIFSFLWIIIGKGAHYWYLKYYFVLENEYNKNHNLKEISYFNLPPIGVEDSLLSTHPGRYSLSRSQIAIGIVLLLIWSVVFITHTVQFVVNDGLGLKISATVLYKYGGYIIAVLLAFDILMLIPIWLLCLKHEGKGDYPLEIDKKINKIGDELKALKQKKAEEKDEEKRIKDSIIQDADLKNYFEDEEKLNKLVEYLYNKYCKK